MTIWLVRHGHAGDRHRWDGDQDGRPLSKRGRAEAIDITQRLLDQPIERVLSSPAARCQQTVEPLAEKLGLDVEVVTDLYEGSSSERTLALVDDLLTTDAVLCSHGDVIPDLLRALRRRGLESNGIGACEKGSAWELMVQDGTIKTAIYHPPGA